MRILVSNDDGYLSTGIQTLAAALREVAEVDVVAPDRNQSAASQSLTLSKPLRVHEHGDRVYSVDGTPSDCVNIAVSSLFDKQPDMVISGINDGPNLGDDVIYSGTVAAAIEGRHLGYPALAVSMASYGATHYETAAQVMVKLLLQIQKQPLPIDTILNINVPDLPADKIKGIVSTRLGARHPSEAAVKQLDPRGRPIYWIGAAGEVADAKEETDFYVVQQGYVSVTPLQIDLTKYRDIAMISDWLGNIE